MSGEFDSGIPREETGDRDQTPDVYDLMAAFGNHEAKSLVLLYIWRERNLLARYQMGKGFVEAQGESPVWKMHTSGPFGYCEQSLEPIGAVVKGRVPLDHRDDWADAYQISEIGTEIGVPAAGLILDWSLRWENLSVQEIFGGTNSQSDIRAPFHHINTLRQIANFTGTEGLSTSEIAGVDKERMDPITYHTRLANIASAVSRLQAAGIVHQETVFDENSRQYLIHNPNYPTTAPIQPRGEITELIYRFIRQRHSDGINYFSYEEVFRYVVAGLGHSDRSPELAEVHRQTLQKINNNTTLPGIEVMGKEYANFTLARLNENHREAIEELLYIVDGIDNKDQDLLAFGRERAAEIIADQSTIATIMGKAYSFSPNARKMSKVETQEQILALLSDESSLNLDEVAEIFNRTYSRKLKPATVAQRLRELEASGAVKVERKRQNPRLNRKRKYFSLQSSE